MCYVAIGSFVGKGWTAGASLGQKALLGVRSHPHFELWRSMQGLVRDGIDFVAAQITARTSGGGGGEYEAVGAAVVAEAPGAANADGSYEAAD